MSITITQMGTLSIPEGVHKPYDVSVAGEAVASLVFVRSCFSISAFNDGPDPCYVMINKVSEKKAPVLKGEMLAVKFDFPVINKVFFICDAGKTANLRIHTFG